MIDFQKSVFLLDGITEIRSFTQKFEMEFGAHVSVRKVGCNGRDVTAAGYANAALGILKEVLGRHYTMIICIADREGRRCEAAEFSTHLRQAIFRLLSHPGRNDLAELETKIKVCIPDRMFENWIIADVEGIRTHKGLVRVNAKQRKFDGTNGAHQLKAMMKVPYKKALHAPVLFKSVRIPTAVGNSPSFRHFADLLGII